MGESWRLSWCHSPLALPAYFHPAMCSIGDNWVLMGLLLLQCVCGLPVMALMKLCGIAYALLYSFGFLVSLCVAFVPSWRSKCCVPFVTFVNEYGLCIFLLTHMALLSLASYTLYQIITPFLTITPENDFAKFCVRHKLNDNLSHTGCEGLQAFYALSLVALTIANIASAYLLLVGSRITRHHWLSSEDHERLLKRRGSVV